MVVGSRKLHGNEAVCSPVISRLLNEVDRGVPLQIEGAENEARPFRGFSLRIGGHVCESQVPFVTEDSGQDLAVPVTEPFLRGLAGDGEDLPDFSVRRVLHQVASLNLQRAGRTRESGRRPRPHRPTSPPNLPSGSGFGLLLQEWRHGTDSPRSARRRREFQELPTFPDERGAPCRSPEDQRSRLVIRISASATSSPRGPMKTWGRTAAVAQGSPSHSARQ